MTEPFGMPTFVKVGKKKTPKQLGAPSTVRPPTESGPATTIDLTSGDSLEGSTVSAPSSQNGDRIYLFVVQSSANATLDANPSGFSLGRVLGTGGGNNPPLNWLFYQDVTTPPASITLPGVSGSNISMAWIAWTVRGGSSHTISSAAGANGSSTNDPPAVGPSDVPGEYLVFIVNGFNADDGSTDTKDDVGGSTGYTPLAYEGDGFTSPHAFLASANKSITTSENPDSYVYPSSGVGNWWTAVTVAVKYTDAEVAAGDHTHVESDVSDISTLTQKATPVDADKVKIYDSEDSDTYKYAEIGDLPGGGATGIDDLSDVTITGTPADNEVVAYDTGTAEFINQTAAEAGLAAATHTHTESDVTDLDHWAEADHDALDHTGLTGVGGSGELLMQDGVTAPPVPIENEAQDDWLYED